MNLLTKDLENQIPPLGHARRKDNPIVHFKFIDTYRGWAWYVIEGSRLEQNEELILNDKTISGDEKFPQDMVFYGFIQGFKKEFGHFYLSELQLRKNETGQPCVEIDFSFKPTRLKKLTFDKI